MPRPKFTPTDRHRKLVRSLAAVGMRQDDIATMIGIKSAKTLRKHCAAELKGGFAEAMRTLTEVAYDMAASGKYPAVTMFWLKAVEGWREGTPAEEPLSPQTDKTPHRGAEMIFLRGEPDAGAGEYLGQVGDHYAYRARGGGPKQSAADSLGQLIEAVNVEKDV